MQLIYQLTLWTRLPLPLHTFIGNKEAETTLGYKAVVGIFNDQKRKAPEGIPHRVSNR